TDLLAIRSAGALARTLRPLDEGDATFIEVVTWFLVLVPPLALVLIFGVNRRSPGLPAPASDKEQSA
ncbi:MAG: hypothetical protein AAF602_08145, partial [Myxococcota bacterium]